MEVLQSVQAHSIINNTQEYIDFALVYTPLLCEIFNKSLGRFANTSELVSLRSVSKVFRNHFDTSEISIYLRYIHHTIKLDLTDCCKLTELRTLVTRLMIPNWLTPANIAAKIFAINNQKVFVAAQLQGIADIISREKMITYSVMHDSELMLESILLYHLQMMISAQHFDVFILIGNACAIRCLGVAKKLLSYSTRAYTTMIKMAKIHKRGNVFIKDIIMDYCSDGSCFDTLYKDAGIDWLVNSVLRYPPQNTMEEYTQLVKCIIDYTTEDSFTPTAKHSVYFLIAAAASPKTLNRLMTNFKYFASAHGRNRVSKQLCNLRIGICSRTQFEAALVNMSEIFGINIIEKIRRCIATIHY